MNRSCMRRTYVSYVMTSASNVVIALNRTVLYRVVCPETPVPVVLYPSPLSISSSLSRPSWYRRTLNWLRIASTGYSRS